MKVKEFKKQEISANFDTSIDEAPKFKGFKCVKVENCHTNGLSTYFTYIHHSGTVKIIVRQSNHFARHDNEERGFVDGEMIFPAVIKTTNFQIFNHLSWMEEKNNEYLIEKFCK